MNSPSIIERAYQLAKSGECSSLITLKTRLKQEGYVNIEAHMEGLAIKRNLRRLFAGPAISFASHDRAGAEASNAEACAAD